MTIKAVIFDLDGVLIDSEPINYEANKLTFEKVGVYISKEEFIQEWIIKGTGTREAIKRHNIKASYEDLQKIKELLINGELNSLDNAKLAAENITNLGV